MKHYDIHIHGRVQRVGYRYSAWYEANRIGITGYVKNMHDGSVYAEAEGTQEQLDHFLAWCRRDRAVVEAVVPSEGALKGFKDFIIK